MEDAPHSHPGALGRGCCPECGAVLSGLPSMLASRDEQIEIQREDIQNLERELRTKRGQIRKLREDQDAALRDSPQYEAAMEVLTFWRKMCAPKARELSGKRLEAVMARLRGGYAAAELKQAIVGYAARPYVTQGRRTATGASDDLHVDAELIFRDAKHVDLGIRMAEQGQAMSSALSDPVPAPVSGPSEVVQPELVLSDLGATALRLAAAGFLVFPCLPGRKQPATRRGLLDAKSDADAIRVCWAKYPDMNVGLRTGAESSIVVLDVDGEAGADSLHRLEETHGRLPVTLSVTTPSGGVHYYFRHPGVEVRNTQGVPGEGLDIRGDGGYVLAPPSIHPNGGRYTVDEEAPLGQLPAWLLNLVLAQQGEGAARPLEYWATLAANGTTAGQRNGTVAQYTGHLLNSLPPEEVLPLIQAWNYANIKPPLSEKEVERTVRSIVRTRERGGRQ